MGLLATTHLESSNNVTLSHFPTLNKSTLPSRKVVRNHVESPRGWRALARGEQDAGLETDTRVQVSFYRCDLCWIHIGPGHYETSLYLYPVQRETLHIGDGPPQYITSSWLRICGSCAHHRSRELPEFLCLMAIEDWKTTRLLTQAKAAQAGHPSVSFAPEMTQLDNYAQMKQIRAEVQAQVKQRLTAFFLLFYVARGFPLSALMHSSNTFPAIKNTVEAVSSLLYFPTNSTQKRTDECPTLVHITKTLPSTPTTTFLQNARPVALRSFFSDKHSFSSYVEENVSEDVVVAMA